MIRIIAHRGYSSRYPENTALAFEQAIAAGADLIETDLRLTRDGKAVCSHDADLGRVAGVNRAIADATLLELKALRLPQDRVVATLGEVLAIARGRVRVMLDVKIDADAMRAEIWSDVRAAGMEREVFYGVRSVSHLHALRQTGNPVPVVAMPDHPELLPAFLGDDVRATRLWEEEASAAAIERVRGAGLQAWVTAGRRARGEAAGRVTAGRVARLIALGADAVLVNDIKLAVRARRAATLNPRRYP